MHIASYTIICLCIYTRIVYNTIGDEYKLHIYTCTYVRISIELKQNIKEEKKSTTTYSRLSTFSGRSDSQNDAAISRLVRRTRRVTHDDES